MERLIGTTRSDSVTFTAVTLNNLQLLSQTSSLNKVRYTSNATLSIIIICLGLQIEYNHLNLLEVGYTDEDRGYTVNEISVKYETPLGT